MKNLVSKVVKCAVYAVAGLAGGVIVYTGLKLTNASVDLFVDEVFDHKDQEDKEVENEPQ